MTKWSIWAASLCLAATVLAGPEQVPVTESKQAVVPTAPACNWQRFYIGVNGGYTFDFNTEVTDIDSLNVGPPPESFSFQSDGAVGGGQIGFNLQPWRWLVLGLEADGGYLGLDGKRTQPRSPFNATFAEIDPGAYVTARGRVGLALNCVLLYATGGWFGSNYERKLVDDETCTCGGTLGSGRCDDFRSGYTVGGGAEWMFSHHWSFRVEYLYFDVEGSTVNVPIQQSGTFRFRFDDDNGNIVRAGLNFLF